MSEDRRLFLTHTQALTAIRADIEQYAPQKSLFRALCPILLGRQTVAAPDEDGVWIETGKPGKMKAVSWETLRGLLCTAVSTLPKDLDHIAGILSRVFEAPVEVGIDDSGKQGVWLETGMGDFTCRLCGRCCSSLDYHDHCTAADIHRWRLAGRHDLIARARPIRGGGRISHYRIWISADGRHTRQTCPWLRPAGEDRFICSIQDHKPEICRQYPGSRKHARMTGCTAFATPVLDAAAPDQTPPTPVTKARIIARGLHEPPGDDLHR